MITIKGIVNDVDMDKMVLTERDYAILREVNRFRFCLGRHIKSLVGFNGVRACDRRLSKLVEASYIARKKVLYGVPSLYVLTNKGKIVIGAVKRQDKIRVEQIAHDITVLDAIIYFISKYKIPLSKIVSEKELHKADGFGTRRHQPDFVFYRDDKSFCVEVELSLKAKARLIKNIEQNFLSYDNQIWIVPQKESKVIELIEQSKVKYDGIEIVSCESVVDI